MSKPSLQDYILGRGPGQSKGPFGKVLELLLILIIALVVRFTMVITEVTIIPIPVVDPILKAAFTRCEQLLRERYYH